MLSKSKRLNLSKNFKWVTQGKKVECSSFKIFYRAGENNFPLVGIALRKAYFHDANKRNQAKRIVSSEIEKHYENLPSSLNLVIMPKELILKTTKEDLKKEIESVISRFSSN